MALTTFNLYHEVKRTVTTQCAQDEQRVYRVPTK